MDRNDFSPGSAWGIVPEKFEALLRQFRDLQADAAMVKEAAAFVPDGIDGPSYRVVDGVALVDIHGPVSNRMSFFAWLYGAAILPRIRYDLEEASKDAQIKAIVLDIDSPGGPITGVDDTARLVRAVNKIKPVIAYTGGMMASSAYWIGSAAGEVAAARSADVGSIGVFMVHEDWSKFDERVGIATTVIKSGKYKALHLEPLTDDGKAVLQAEVDAVADIFIASVAEGRGVAEAAVRSRMADGRVFIGQAAVDNGLADRLSTLDEVIASAVPSGTAGFSFATAAVSSAAHEKEIDMKFKDLKEMEAAFPELVKQAREEGAASVDVSAAREEGFQAGAKAERERIQAVEAQAMPGHEKLIAQLKFDGKTTGPEAAVQVLTAERQVRVNAAQNLAADAADQPPVPAAIAPEPAAQADATDDDRPVEERAKAEWEKDAKLRKEFDGNYDAYLAYKKAVAGGQVKMFRKK